jgi:cytochrome b subunit of formate dehydrogenase
MDNISDKTYIRMTLNERIQHFLLLSSFITLVITGFALKFPESLWVTAIYKMLGENTFDLRGLVHRIAAVIMVAVSLYHLWYIFFHARGKQLVKDLWFKKSDISDLQNAFKYYIGKTKTRPKYGRFSYIEKAEYWAVVWGTIVMGATGSVLWFENTFLPVISNSGMNLATAIHYYEAILASLAIFVWHFYFVIYNPDVYPINKVWFRGYMSREEMELEHPLELEKIDELEMTNEREMTEENPEKSGPDKFMPAEITGREEEKKIIELIESVEKAVQNRQEPEFEPVADKFLAVEINETNHTSVSDNPEATIKENAKKQDKK